MTKKDINRQSLLEKMYEIILEAMEKSEAKRYRGESHSIRNNYYRSVAMLVNSFKGLYADIELDELKEEVRKLKEDDNND